MKGKIYARSMGRLAITVREGWVEQFIINVVNDKFKANIPELCFIWYENLRVLQVHYDHLCALLVMQHGGLFIPYEEFITFVDLKDSQGGVVSVKSMWEQRIARLESGNG